MRTVSELLVRVIEDHAEIRHDYSGRGMFGEKCFGFVVENPEAAIAEIQADINGIYEPEELRQECYKRLPPELTEILHEWEGALYNEEKYGKINNID